MKTLGVCTRRSELVSPASPTPHTTLCNSNLDLLVPPLHLPTICFYKKPPHHQRYSDSLIFRTWEILKEALAKALVPFYPLAGRLRLGHENARIEIDCNAAGALLAEATADACIDDFGDFAPDPVCQHLLPKVDYAQHISSHPLLLLQVTFFRCGGASLGIAMHHNVADGMSAVYFINTLADIARGESLKVPPFIDRTLLKARSPPTPHFSHIEYKPPPSLLQEQSEGRLEHKYANGASKAHAKMDHLLPPNGTLSDATVTDTIARTNHAVDQDLPPPISARVFKFTKDQLRHLKSQGEDTDNLITYSSFEMLSGHLWRSVCKARRLVDEQETKLYIATDGRSRLTPPLPESYFGNAIFTATPMATVGELLSKPLYHAASRIHKAVAAMDDEYLRSALDFLELQPDLRKLVRGPHTFKSPNLGMSSWARLPMYNADFGWGKPIYTGPATISCEGLAYVLQSPKDDGSLSLCISLQTDHMRAFEKIINIF